MLNNMPHISSLYANSWVAWVMFALLVMAICNPLSRLVGVTWRGVFTHSERAYTVHVRNWMSEIVLRVFRLGVVALAMLVVVKSASVCQLGTYAKGLAIVAVVYIVQTILLYGVGSVFLSSKRMEAALEQYSLIRTLACIWLYPILLLLINISVPLLPQVLCGIVGGVYIVVLIGKSFQLFYTRPLSVVYILLYVLCLEILPLMVSVLALQHFV